MLSSGALAMLSSIAVAGPSAALTRLSAFDQQANGITAARLLLASLVIVSHSVSLAGMGLEPLVAETGSSIGFLAVIAFFTLSGFLLARSRERTDAMPFVRNRLLRIMPGYWLALIFGAVVALAFGASLKGAMDYVTSNLALFVKGASGTEAFGGLPLNGSLWTLRVEMFAYIALVVVPRRWLRPVALGELAILVGMALDRTTADTDLLLAFAFGVCAWLWRRRIPMVPLVALPAFLVGNAVLWPLAVVACGYAGLAMAGLPWRLDRDLSYGAYVLAYPVQLAIATAGLPLPVMIAASFAVILPLAFLSWTILESPALSLRHRPTPGGERHPRFERRSFSPVDLASGDIRAMDPCVASRAVRMSEVAAAGRSATTKWCVAAVRNSLKWLSRPSTSG